MTVGRKPKMMAMCTTMAFVIVLAGSYNVVLAADPASPPAGCPPGTTTVYNVVLASASTAANATSQSPPDHNFFANVSAKLALTCNTLGNVTQVVPKFGSLSCTTSAAVAQEDCKDIFDLLNQVSKVLVTQNPTTGEFLNVTYNESQAELVSLYVGALNGLNANIDVSRLPNASSSYTYQRPSMRLPGATVTFTVRRLSDDEKRALDVDLPSQIPCFSTTSEAVYLDRIEESGATHCIYNGTKQQGGVHLAKSNTTGNLGLGSDSGDIEATELLSVQTLIGDFVFAVDLTNHVWRNLVPANGSGSSSNWTAVPELSDVVALSGCEGSPCMMFVQSGLEGGDVFASCWSPTSQWSTPSRMPMALPSTGVSCWLDPAQGTTIVSVYSVAPLGDVWQSECEAANLTSCNGQWENLGNLTSPALYFWPAIDVTALKDIQADGVVFALDTAYILQGAPTAIGLTPLATSGSGALNEIASATFACTESDSSPIVATLQYNHQVTLSMWNPDLQVFVVNASVDSIEGCAELMGYPTSACGAGEFGFVVLGNNGSVYAIEGLVAPGGVNVTSVFMIATFTYTISTAFGPVNDTGADFFLLQYDASVIELTRVSKGNWTTKPLPPFKPDQSFKVTGSTGSRADEDSGFALFQARASSLLFNTESTPLPAGSTAMGVRDHRTLTEAPDYTTKPFNDQSWYQGPQPDEGTLFDLLHNLVESPLSTTAQNNILRAVSVGGDPAVTTLMALVANGSVGNLQDEIAASAVLSVFADAPTPSRNGVDFLADVIALNYPSSVHLTYANFRIAAAQESVEIAGECVTNKLINALRNVSSNSTDPVSGPALTAYGAVCDKLQDEGRNLCASTLLTIHRNNDSTPTQRLSALLALGNTRHPHAIDAAHRILSESDKRFDVPHRVAATRALRKFDRDREGPSTSQAAHRGDVLLHQAALYDTSPDVRRVALRTMDERGEPTPYNVLNTLKHAIEPRHTVTQSDILGFEQVFRTWLQRLQSKPSVLRRAAKAGIERALWLRRMEEAFREEYRDSLDNTSTPNSVVWRHPFGGSNAAVTPYAGAGYSISDNGFIRANAETGVTGSLFGKDFNIIRAGVTVTLSNAGEVVGLVFVTAYMWDPVRGQTTYDIFARQWKLAVPFTLKVGNPCVTMPPGQPSKSVAWSTTFFRASAFYGIPMIADVDVELALQGSISIGYGFTIIATSNGTNLTGLPFLLEAYAQPSASLEAVASGNVRAVAVSGGVRGTLSFADMKIPLIFGINSQHLTFVYSGNLTGTFLKGTLDLFYSIFWCKPHGLLLSCGGSNNIDGTRSLLNWTGSTLSYPFIPEPPEDDVCPSGRATKAPRLDSVRSTKWIDHSDLDQHSPEISTSHPVADHITEADVPSEGSHTGNAPPFEWDGEYNDCTDMEDDSMNVDPKMRIKNSSAVKPPPHKSQRTVRIASRLIVNASVPRQLYLAQAWNDSIVQLGTPAVPFSYDCVLGFDPQGKPTGWPYVCGNTICALLYYPMAFQPYHNAQPPTGIDWIYHAAYCGGICPNHREFSLGGALPRAAKDPAGITYDRDEFPLNSMTAGGCLTRIQAIDRGDNRRHGASIGGYYRANKLLPGGGFDIRIPSPGDVLARIKDPADTNWKEYCTRTDFRLSDYRWAPGAKVSPPMWYDTVVPDCYYSAKNNKCPAYGASWGPPGACIP